MGDERFTRMTADAGASSVYVAHTVSAAVPRLMFVLMPGFALLTWLSWRNSLPRYREHLWFSLHLHSAWFASMTVAALAQIAGVVAIEVLAGLGVLIYCTWYSAVAMQRVLGGTGRVGRGQQVFGDGLKIEGAALFRCQQAPRIGP